MLENQKETNKNEGPMHKTELLELVQKELGKEATKACAESALDAVLEAIKKGVKKDHSVQLIGFGTFSIAERPARTGLNPRTKEKIKIPASKSVKFKVGSQFKALFEK